MKAGITKRAPKLIQHWRDLGETPEDFLERLVEGLATINNPANRGKLTEPEGALFWHLWNRGGWPIGVTMIRPTESRRRREAKAAEEADRQHEQLLEQAIEIGRREGLSVSEIVRGLLEEGVPREFVDAAVKTGLSERAKFRIENFDATADSIVADLKSAIGQRWYMWFDDCTLRWDASSTTLEVVHDSEFTSAMVRRRFGRQIADIGCAHVTEFKVLMVVEAAATQSREGAKTQSSQ